MAISLDCFIAALAPFTPSPADLTHPERLAGKIDDWLNPSRLLAKASASKFHIEPAGLTTFDGWWDLAKPARELHDEGHKPDGSGDIDAELRQAFVRLGAIVNNGAQLNERGYRHVHRMSGTGRFVIFSDLHMAFPGSRQDFFRTSGNAELYAEILEDMPIAASRSSRTATWRSSSHEPIMPPPDAQLSLLKKVKDTNSLDDDGWKALDKLRADWRRAQLAQVIQNHQTLYHQINTQFVETGRYIRIAGNHDQDLQGPRFLDVLRTAYPKLENVYDILILEAAGAISDTFVICHGHHFDNSATPKYSTRIGETLSECLGWAYEGADRAGVGRALTGCSDGQGESLSSTRW